MAKKKSARGKGGKKFARKGGKTGASKSARKAERKARAKAGRKNFIVKKNAKKAAKRPAIKAGKKAASKPAAKAPAGPPPGPPEMPPEALIMQTMFGFMMTKGLGVAASLGIADALKGGPLYYTDLASVLGADQRALHRVMRMLAGHGIFAEPKAGTFANNPVSDLLRADHPQSMVGMAKMICGESHWQPWGRLEHTVRTGKSGAFHAFGEEIFTWFQKPENKDEWDVFNDAMTSMSMGQAPLIAESYDFSRFSKIVDVGGGHGLLLKHIMAKAPNATGVLFDMPDVVAGADLPEYIERQGGDFFERVPDGGDCYVMKAIIHDWSDDHCRKILSNIARAMNPDGRVLLFETVMPEEPGPHPSKFADVNMLAMTDGGCERTPTEFRKLFESAGLQLVGITPLPDGWTNIIEARRA
ncbi:MAG: methyltransferase domain-containing protein [Planctomycetes bacterium]|nr:methyltransferase domain-containing protein [Planctomycetota bacterium]MCW8134524.1 methyltransferase domain-containing protein [Planctomycetota bacterium]